MPSKLLIYACTLLLAALSATSVSAQAVSDSEAQRLQTVFQTMLETRKTQIAEEGSERTLSLEGDVSVEPAGSYYAITLPQMKITYPDGRHIDFGMIAMNASPHDQPGQYKMTMAIPSPILGFDENDEEIMRLSIGAQKTAGIWNEKLENFTKLDALYSNITINIDQGATLVKLPELRTIYDLEEGENGRWSGPVSFEAKDISASSEEDKTQMSLQSLSITSALDQFAAQAFNPSQTSAEETLSPLKMADGVDFNLRLGNLKLIREADDETSEDMTFAAIAVGFNFDGALSNTASAGFSMSFQDLTSADTPQDIKAILPKSGRFKLTHHNIPMEPLSEILGNTAEGGASILGMSLLFKVPAILAQAGSYIEIQDSFLSNDDYRVDLQSILRADIAAANSATAEGTLRFAGLDKVLSMAQVAGTRLNASTYAKPMRELARFLERLKPLGRIETSPESGFVHVFDLEMNAAGQFLINGQDAKPLLSKQEPILQLQQVEP